MWAYALATMFSELGISAEDWERTPQAVRTIVLSLQHQLRLFHVRHTGYEHQLAALKERLTPLDDLQAEVEELRERVNQNSRNSSLPPSSDPPHQPPPPASNPKGRKRGAQAGHQGTGRKLKPQSEVDHIIELRAARCRACGCDLEGDDPRPARHQVAEVPRVRAEVTEYRRHTLHCAACGVTNRAEFPAEMQGTTGWRRGGGRSVGRICGATSKRYKSAAANRRRSASSSRSRSRNSSRCGTAGAITR